MKEKAMAVLGIVLLTLTAETVIAGGIFLHDAIESSAERSRMKREKKKLEKLQKAGKTA